MKAKTSAEILNLSKGELVVAYQDLQIEAERKQKALECITKDSEATLRIKNIARQGNEP